MYRIGNFFENRLGRNDGNPLYVQAFLKRVQFYSETLYRGHSQKYLTNWCPPGGDPKAKEYAEKLWKEKNIAVEIDHIIPTGDLENLGKFDLYLWVDWGEDGLVGVLPYEPIFPPGHPLAYWTSDTHLGYDYRLKLARQSDFVFCAQKRAVEEFKRDGIPNPIWLPHAVEPLAYPKLDFASKQYDVCFVGHINSDNRIDALDRLFKEFPNFYFGQRLFEKAAEKYAKSKISFNISHVDDVNMRCFEVLAAGGFLLTNSVPTLHELFFDGVHCAVYKDLDDMVAKAHYYLDHEDERERIAKAGYDYVIQNHTIQHRIETMLEIVMSKEKSYASV